MNAVTGHGIIFAILCHAMETGLSEGVFGILAGVFGTLGICMEIADRKERKKVNDNGGQLSRSPR